MSIDIPAIKNREPVVDNFEIDRPHAQYSILWTEGADSNPEIALRAQQIHGQSYVEYGYFNKDGLGEDGRLVPELDGTRERPQQNVVISYLLAVPKGRTIDEAEATIRMIGIGERGTIEDIPTYKYFKENFSSGVKERLEEIVETYGAHSVRELAALATAGHAGHPGAYELMRAIVQNATLKRQEDGEAELYIAALTDKSLGRILKFAGSYASKIIGEPTHIFTDEARAAEIRVTPVLIDPCKIIEGVVLEMQGEASESKYRVLKNKLSFLTDGLTDAQMGERVATYLRGRAA